ncbi:beta-1,3-glucan-binding protein-like [Leguminivora glycinivorella]|uniref:beta-1,3-glucan-binding protein-like n=1 Tax=Leguminivora glycinivorella TaxID=1035111 RepID=UPI00200FCE65|nr:beta-1,3-glucan-binding protein-like [Leguminivora glycinivorella]
MASSAFGRALALVALSCFTRADDTYNVPEVAIQAFKPKGFRASIPDAPDLALFVFQGNVNRKIESTQVGEIHGEVLSPKNGRWVVELPDVALAVGDVINYHVFASVKSTGYVKDKLTFTVTQLEDYAPLDGPTTPRNPNCAPTLTRLRGGVACAGQTIFEENFDSLRTDIWQVQSYVPVDHSEHPFISYQRSAVSVQNGNLRIVPSLQQNQPGFSADKMLESLDLYKGCTSETSGACFVQANDGSGIIPPVVSGRITSKPGFAFTYGTVTVRAKLPQGDWLYPEILLEPLMKKFVFGSVNSGVVKIACSRGNKELNVGYTNYGNKVLYSGPVIDTTCHDSLLVKKNSNAFWGDGFHDYSVKWTPERLILSVDGLEYGRVEPASNGLRGLLPAGCSAVQQTGMAPFDDHFYITLGLSAGGHTEFPDGALSQNSHEKPWKNQASKAPLRFWNDVDAWEPTWRQPELLVDYVKVVAL